MLNGQPCRLTELVAAMPRWPHRSIFCRRDGEPVAVPYPDCHRDALAVASALTARGVEPGDRVAIHGDTSYEWVLADLGCLVAGAVSVAVYPSAPLPRALATVRQNGCRVVFTDREDFVAGFAAAGLDVVFLGSRGPGVPSVGQFLAAGTPASSTPVSRGGEPFTVVSTSGTLAEPKLFAVHSAPLLYTMDRFAELYGIGGADRLLLYLPLSHLPQRMILYWSLGVGMDIVLSDPRHLAGDTEQLSPTVHVAVPRSLEHLHRRAREALRRDGDGGTLARRRTFQAAFGSAIRTVFVGSAASDPKILADLLEAGLPVYEVYGTTEIGMVALNTPGATRIGTVGRPIPWGSVRLDPDSSEILVRTPTPFLHGHVRDGGIEPAVVEPDAWWRTGDVGHLDGDGYLTVRGRLRDFLVLTSGEKIFVRPIEDALAKATGASLCVLTQTGQGRLGALLFFDPAADLTGRSRPSYDECRDGIDRLNATLHPWERIREFGLVDRLPSVAEGTVTDTMKLRRHRIEQIYVPEATWRRVAG